MPRPLVDSRLLAALVNAFPQTVALGASYVAQDAYGAESPTWSDAPFLVDDAGDYLVDDTGAVLVSGTDDTVACCLWPIKAQEIRRPDQTIAVATHQALLAAYRPDLTVENRATIAGTVYDILAVEHDSQHLATRLLLEVVT